MPSVAANALAMLAAKLLPPLFAFAIHVSIARLAGAETLGGYVHLLAVLMIFQAMAGAGMQFLVTREIAADSAGAPSYVRQARSFGLVSGAVATVAYVAYAAWLLPPGRLLPALALALTILPSAFIAVQEAVFLATRTHGRVAIVAVVENAVKTTIALAALVSGQGLLAICLGIAAARLVGLATGSWLLARNGLGGTWGFDASTVRPFARAIAPFTALFVLSMAYFRIDIAIVEATLGEEATGFYGAAATLFGALLLLPEAAMAAAYPRLASAFRASRDGYARATWLVAKVLGLGLVAVSLALIWLAEPIVGLAYGRRFLASVPVLRLLALSLPLHALNGALGQALQAGREQRAMVGVVASGLVVHVALNVALVRAFGIEGAALAMLLSSSFVAAGALLAVHRRVAPVPLTARTLLRTLPMVGPLALAILAPAGWRLGATVMGLLWLAIGAIGHGTLVSADLAQVREALRIRRAGAVA